MYIYTYNFINNDTSKLISHFILLILCEFPFTSHSMEVEMEGQHTQVILNLL